MKAADIYILGYNPFSPVQQLQPPLLLSYPSSKESNQNFFDCIISLFLG